MRIAMLADYPADARQIVGGVQAVTVYLVRALAQYEDVELHVLTTDPGASRDREIIDGRVALHRVATRSPLKSVPKLLAVDAPRLIRKARSLAPDVVHAQGADIYGYAAIHSGLPAVVTLHGMLREDARYWTTRRERLRGRIAAALFEQRCVRRARHVISISPYVREYWGSRLAGRVHPIENPVDGAYFELPTEGSRSGSILYAGVIAPRKRVHDLIAAVTQVRAQRLPVTLRIAGRVVDEAYAETLHASVAAAGAEDIVTFLGNLDEGQVVQEFARCSMLALPSAQETAPMVIEQAMAAGKPVVATRVGGVPHLVSHGQTGLLVSPGDVRGLAAAIAQLVEQPDLAAAMGAAARAQAWRRFYADAVARQTLDTYRQVAGAPARSVLPREVPFGEIHRA